MKCYYESTSTGPKLKIYPETKFEETVLSATFGSTGNYSAKAYYGCLVEKRLVIEPLTEKEIEALKGAKE